jgi:hypothetical protein
MADSLNGIINQLERQKTAIDRALAALQGIEGIRLPAPATSAPASEAPVRKHRKFSAATRRKMALAQKARWAKLNGEGEPLSPATPKAPKPKRRISAEGMKRIIAATKKRWRVQKAAAKKAA